MKKTIKLFCIIILLLCVCQTCFAGVVAPDPNVDYDALHTRIKVEKIVLIAIMTISVVKIIINIAKQNKVKEARKELTEESSKEQKEELEEKIIKYRNRVAVLIGLIAVCALIFAAINNITVYNSWAVPQK